MVLALPVPGYDSAEEEQAGQGNTAIQEEINQATQMNIDGQDGTAINCRNSN